MSLSYKSPEKLEGGTERESESFSWRIALSSTVVPGRLQYLSALLLSLPCLLWSPPSPGFDPVERKHSRCIWNMNAADSETLRQPAGRPLENVKWDISRINRLKNSGSVPENIMFDILYSGWPVWLWQIRWLIQRLHTPSAYKWRWSINSVAMEEPPAGR